MKRWLARARGVLGMGLIWAAGGIGVGGLIELLDNVLPGGLAIAKRVDMWPQTLAIPGFIGGVIFAIVLLIAGRKYRFDQLSMRQFLVWGAMAGMLLGGLAMSIGAPLLFVAITTLAGTVAAFSSLLLARRAEKRELLVDAADETRLLSDEQS